MPEPSQSLAHYKTDEQLLNLYQKIKLVPIKSLFDNDPDRFKKFHIKSCGLLADFSRHHIDDNILKTLISLAKEANLSQAIEKLFHGALINCTENRAALHTALRAFAEDEYNKTVFNKVNQTKQKIKAITSDLHDSKLKGFSGKNIDTVVHIGIGGSYLGVHTVIKALESVYPKKMNYHYLVSIDPIELEQLLAKIVLEKTLFIIVSKSFSTLETLQNAKIMRTKLLEQGCSTIDLQKHFIAISSDTEAVKQLGIAEENLLPLWDWVGGRYSTWSSVGLLISLVLGFDSYERFLFGAHQMDLHFKTQPFEQNLPVIMALLGIWYRNYFNRPSHAVLSYGQPLSEFKNYLQQLEMESNGKSTNIHGETLTYSTAPIIWGGVGTNDQHSYFQFLHQGSNIVPVDMITSLCNNTIYKEHHDWLFANMLAQANAFILGSDQKTLLTDIEKAKTSNQKKDWLLKHRTIYGNRPSTILLLEQITPETIGSLLALYEHKVYTQSVIWNINAFDQWGVELGKTMSKAIYEKITNPYSKDDTYNNYEQLIALYRKTNHLPL